MRTRYLCDIAGRKALLSQLTELLGRMQAGDSGARCTVRGSLC